MIKRRFILGDEWLYLKIYIGEVSAEKFLVNIFPHVVKQLQMDDLVEKYFFIRYTDEMGFHLRVRFYISAINNINIIIVTLRNFLEPYVCERIISKVVFDTYVREIERYGDDEAYNKTENAFCIDSKYQLMLLNIINKSDYGENYRWKTGLVMMDRFLDVAGYTERDKLNFLSQLRDNFRIEFNCNSPNYIHQHDRVYRNMKKQIDELFSKGLPHELDCIIDDWETEIRNNYFMRGKIYYLSEFGYLSSIIHMMVNRLFISSNRRCEMALYEFLYKYTQSRIARKQV